MTIAQVQHLYTKELAGVSDSPTLDSDWLLLHLFGQKETSWLYAHSDEHLTQSQRNLLKSLVKKRAAGKPLAYILGEWEFYGRPFYVTPDVLIPRPSTEALIDAALDYLTSITTLRNEVIKKTPLVIADVGTGSGCIIISLALELTSLSSPLFTMKRGDCASSAGGEVIFFATDFSAKALAVARRNAERHGVANQIKFLQGNMFEPLAGQKIDLVVSNPPYISTGELSGADQSVATKGLQYEPAMALDGGSNGLDFVRRLTALTYPLIIETIGGQIIKKNL